MSLSGTNHARNFSYLDHVLNSSHIKMAIHQRDRVALEIEQGNDDWWTVGRVNKANKWDAAGHNVTAIVGAGVLALPHVLKIITLPGGIFLLVVSWLITLYTLWQMVELHEAVPKRRFNKYHELGQEAFGPKLGLWIVVPLQLIVEVGLDIVYMVTVGQSLQHIYKLLGGENRNLLFVWVAAFALVQMILSLLPNLNSIAKISITAAVMSVSYSTIAWGISAYDISHHGNSCMENSPSPSPSPSENNHTAFDVMNSLGIVAFAYAGHNVVLEIQATIPTSPEKKSKHEMWSGVLLAYAVVGLCYFPVAIIGHQAYQDKVTGNILTFMCEPKWLVIMANFMVVIHFTGSYQIFAQPLYDMFETVFVKLEFNPSTMLRFGIRFGYVGFTMFMAMLLPFFSSLLGFFGGFAFGPTTYFLPCCMWLVLQKPRRFSRHWIASWVCIILGIVLMFAAIIGGAAELQKEIKIYHAFSTNSDGGSCSQCSR